MASISPTDVIAVMPEYSLAELEAIGQAATQYAVARRAEAEAAEQAAEAAQRAMLDATRQLASDAHEDGAPWQAPTGVHDAYLSGVTVTHDGKTWTSLIDFNVHQPGVSGWREVATEGTTPAWTAPSGVHDAYSVGDWVTHDGHLWECTVPACTWEPGVYGWDDLGPA